MFEFLLTAVATVVAVTVLVFSAIIGLEVLLAAWAHYFARKEQSGGGDAPSYAILMPAHDEALGIANTIAGILPELSSKDRLIVIADNCRDDTAAIARSTGAEVIEREDVSHRGKGYALDFGIKHLRADPPPVVIIVDADCRLDSGSLLRIATQSMRTNRPVQARYDFEVPSGSERLALQAFAAQVKNYLRPLGLRQIGMPCQLGGTGMAFPWEVISNANLATGEIVEDLVLGLELAQERRAPQFCPEARVVSAFPSSEEGQATQRSRWETGHLRTIFARLPGHISEALRTKNWEALALSLDAAVPPLALLVMLIAAALVLSALTALLGASPTPLLMSMLAGLVVTASILLAWWIAGRQFVSARQLMAVPYYVASKLGLYARILAGKRVTWERSKRD